MSKLSAITAKATIKEYAQGAAQSATQPIADFLAPTVGVAMPAGYFKKYGDKNRFRIPDTRRAIGGKAVRLGFAASDAKFDCAPHAIDVPVDYLESLADESIVKDAAQMAAEVGALSHEKTVVTKALEVLGAGTDVDTEAAGCDLIKVLDSRILDVIKATKYGSLMSVGLIFGAQAFLKFKNHKSVTGKFTVGGNGATKQLVCPKLEDVSGLCIGAPDVRLSMMVFDDSPEGKDEDIKFILEDEIIVFARLENPSRRDPSFMKTFRLNGQWMVPGTYETEDGRGEVLKMDWSEDVQVANAAAGIRLNLK